MMQYVMWEVGLSVCPVLLVHIAFQGDLNLIKLFLLFLQEEKQFLNKHDINMKKYSFSILLFISFPYFYYILHIKGS